MIQTNIKWYRPDEAMPREGTERVMVAYTFEGSTTTFVSTLHYSSKHKKFNCTDSNNDTSTSMEVDYWAYLITKLAKTEVEL